MADSAYSLSNERLFYELEQAIAPKDHGMMLTCEGWVGDRAWKRYIEGVILSRLDGVSPPFQRECRVRPKRSCVGIPCTEFGTIVRDVVYVVERVSYRNKAWVLHAKEEGSRSYSSRYRAEHFELAPQAQVVG